MIYSIVSRALILVALLLGGSGCSSSGGSERRSVRTGDTPAAVMHAMGEPDEKRGGMVAAGSGTWVYRNHIQRPERQEQTGWSEVLVPAVHDRNGNVVHAEVTRDIPRTQMGNVMQVHFRNGVVSAIEHLTR